jgi:oxygen-independent coproporphyrinogen-3 oxidase
MLEVDEDSRLGRELLGSGTRYHAELVPTDDAIARMYETAIEKLEKAGLRQYEISNFTQPGFQSKHNLRYWERRPYLGLGLDASSALRAGAEPSSRNRRSELRYILRSKTTEDLKDYLSGPQAVETAWLSPERQQEEAWFLGLRLNGGVKLGALKREFGLEGIGRALTVVERLAESGLVVSDGKTVCLTARGRMLSNDVFQEFLFAAEPARDLEETATT